MEPLLIIGIFAILAVLLFGIEVFATPGVGIAGVCATICVVVADILVYVFYDPKFATLILIGSIIIVLVLLWLLANSKLLDRHSLHTDISSTNATAAQLSVVVGEQGKALTRLALIGNAQIGDRVVEVQSAGSFIDEGTPIEVVEVRDALILVRPLLQN